MGGAMAGHLLNAGSLKKVYTRTRSRAQELVDHGAAWAQTPADAAKDVDVVFICVPDTPDVFTVCLGEGGIIESARPGLIVVDFSTIAPAGACKVAEALAAKGSRFLDAPVSGGDVGARNATLSIMVGGDEAAFEKVEPLLQLVGRSAIHMGASGSGQLTKLVNQILVSVTNMAVSEALTFAAKNRLDLKKVISVLSGGAAASWQLTNLGPRMAGRDFEPGFMIDLMQKDLKLVMQAAHESGVCLPASSLVHHLFTAAQAAGHGESGTQALFTVIERLSRGERKSGRGEDATAI